MPRRSPYELSYEPEVLEQIAALPREIQRPLVRRLGELAGDPRPKDVEKLDRDVGYRFVWRSVRITYLLDDANSSVHVVRVAMEPIA